ncbi:MAG TPA: DUF3048 domain-containing protein [Acidimicrobiales bacterium]|nr:DUF3048 domain-containing protein [Acidimicrobiales bacterium]
MPLKSTPLPRRALALLAMVALAVPACSSDSDEPSATPGGDGDKGEKPVPTTVAPRPAPLTGLILSDGTIADRPAVVVKVDNSPSARPQAGLDKADVVIEEKVEGAITRFLAVFHSEDAELVGPVRSVRSTDAPVVSAFGGVFAFAGGIPPFVAMANSAPVTVITEQARPDAFKLRADKRRPFKTYASTERLRGLAGSRSQPPPRLFELRAEGEPFTPAGAVPATHATVVFGGLTKSDWDFDVASNQWRRSTNGTPHVIEGGGQLSFANVIIQRTPYQGTRFTDTSGAKVDEAVVVGSGDAVILSGGSQVAAKWSKPSASAVTTYRDSAGAPIKLAPGRTWISLPPTAAAITVR